MTVVRVIICRDVPIRYLDRISVRYLEKMLDRTGSDRMGKNRSKYSDPASDLFQDVKILFSRCLIIFYSFHLMLLFKLRWPIIKRGQFFLNKLLWTILTILGNGKVLLSI